MDEPTPNETPRYFLVIKKPDISSNARDNLLMSDGLDIKWLTLEKDEVVRFIDYHPILVHSMLCEDVAGARGYVDESCLEQIQGTIPDFLKKKGLPFDRVQFITPALERVYAEKVSLASECETFVVEGDGKVSEVNIPAWQKMASTIVPYAGITPVDTKKEPQPTQPTGFHMSALRPAPLASNPKPPKVLVCKNGIIEVKRHFTNSVVLEDRTETVVLRTGALNQHIVARTMGVYVKEDHEQKCVDVYEVIHVKEAYIEKIYGFEYLIVFIDGIWNQKCSLLLSPDVTYEVKNTE